MITIIHEEADAVIKHLENSIPKGEAGTAKEDAMPTIRDRVIVGEHDDGRPIYKQIQAQSRDALHLKIAQTLTECGRFVPSMRQQDAPQAVSTKTLFKPFMEEFMATFKKGKIRESSYDSYQRVLNANIYPDFGDQYIEDITTEDIQMYFNRRAGSKKKYLEMQKSLLGMIFKYAVEKKLILSDPMDSYSLNIGGQPKEEKEAFTDEQLRTILDGLLRLTDRNERTCLALLLFTGMRKSEIHALRWENVDFENSKIYVRATVSGQGSKATVMPPKTKAGKRDLPLLPALADILRPYRGEGYVFGGGKLFKTSTFDKVYRHVRKHVNLYGATPHIFRHTYVTMLAAQNADIKTAQYLAGQADVATTLGVYAHARAGNIKAAGEKFGENMAALMQPVFE